MNNNTQNSPIDRLHSDLASIPLAAPGSRNRLDLSAPKPSSVNHKYCCGPRCVLLLFFPLILYDDRRRRSKLEFPFFQPRVRQCVVFLVACGFWPPIPAHTSAAAVMVWRRRRWEQPRVLGVCVKGHAVFCYIAPAWMCVGELINRRRRRRLRFDDTNDDDSNHPRSRRYNRVRCDFPHELAITSCSSDG